LQSQDWRDLVEKETGIEQKAEMEIEGEIKMTTMRKSEIKTEMRGNYERIQEAKFLS